MTYAVNGTEVKTITDFNASTIAQVKFFTDSKWSKLSRVKIKEMGFIRLPAATPLLMLPFKHKASASFQKPRFLRGFFMPSVANPFKHELFHLFKKGVQDRIFKYLKNTLYSLHHAFTD